MLRSISREYSRTRLSGEKDEKQVEHAEKLWKLMESYLACDVHTIQRSIVNHVEYTLACTRFNFDNKKAYLAAAHSVRDRLIESWNDTNQFFAEMDMKRVNYLSMEYLMGRTLRNALENMDVEPQYREALQGLGYRLEDLYDEEKDAALGNGGLGRLAACFLDSLATHNYPAWAYGIRYTYGMFQQKVVDGYQVEHPDYWLTFGNPWEIERQDVQYTVRFYGSVRTETVGDKTKKVWEGGECVQAVAYDNPIPGFRTFNTINLRLWKSAPSKEFDLAKFNEGDYMSAVYSRQRAESISHVLYPSDATHHGKELRLKQQYFFVSATLQDIIRRFKKVPGRRWEDFPNKNAIQLNDTHPTIGIPELMRILMDQEGLSYDQAFDITQRSFAYTNHTLLPEALEKWSVGLMEHLLPRHLEIIYEINWHHMQRVNEMFPGDMDRLRSMSIVEECTPKMVRMGHLALVGSHTINGVAALHSELIKSRLFPDFYEMDPLKFQNKTNGVTPRRWLYMANPFLSELITEAVGSDEWVRELSLVQGLRPFAEDAAFRRRWATAKQRCKERLARYVHSTMGIEVNPQALFDVQVKRIHEYKRQLMNCLYSIHRYETLKAMTPEQRRRVQPRVTFFGGKAAPSYTMAKRVIHLIHNVMEVVNNDPETSQLFKVIFLPNYNVSLAEIIIPASDLSQHISTAGKEASGTSNMKFAMNGGLIIGTMDGANVEIAEHIGRENIFIFGALEEEVEGVRAAMHEEDVPPGPEVAGVLELLASGKYGRMEEVGPILDSISGANDYYLVKHDFPSYIEAQERVDEAFRNPDRWWRSSILSTANMGFFSTDRTMHEYASDIWRIDGAPRPDPRSEGGGLARKRSFPNFDPNALAGAAHSRMTSDGPPML